MIVPATTDVANRRPHPWLAGSARRRRCPTAIRRARIDAEGSADLVEELAFPLPAVVVFALIGFPDSDTERLKDWCTDRMSFSWGRPSTSAQAASLSR